ncbi:hypothetical protein [Undibacterium sp. TJN19]|uniref:hypothetical protein n=1 Tax=Undibacterium sp. TJN19 TaxID=3413055 RepID=UPI003BF37C20
MALKRGGLSLRLGYCLCLALLAAFCSLPAQAQLPFWGDYPALPRPAAGSTEPADKSPDPLRMLESLSDAQVRAWMKKQTDFSNAVLSRISGRDALLKRLKILQATNFSSGSLIETRGNQFFVSIAADNRSRVFMRNAATNGERLLLLAEPGQTVDFFSPSADAAYLAVGLARADASGRVRHSLRIIKTSDASMLKENIDSIAPDVQSVAWKADGSAIFYRKAALKPGADKGAVWQHMPGRKVEEDMPLIGPGVSKFRRFAATDMITIKSAAGSAYLLAEVQHGSSLDRSLYLVKQDQLKAAATPWQRLSSPADKVRDAWLAGDNLYLLSAKKKLTGAILKLDLKTAQLSAAKEFVAASTDELLGLAVSKSSVYLHAAEAGYSKLIKIDLASAKREELALPYNGRISQLSADADNEGALFVLEAANAAPLSYRVLAGGQIKNIEILRPTQLGFHRMASKNLSVTLPGTNKTVAMTVLYPQGMELDGKHACLLMLETGTGLARLAKFEAQRLAWLEQDAMIAIVYVPDVPAVKKTSSNEGVDELLAGADYLISEGYTSAKKLVAQEERPGKRLMATMISRRPDLFAAVQGTNLLSEPVPATKSRKASPALRAKETADNAYLNLRDGENYPASLLSARFAVSDAPVWMTSKFAARLQMANANKTRPALFRTDFATSWKADGLTEQADTWAFFLWQTGQKGFSLTP